MKAFDLITTPHKDILDGKLTMDIFAADLWEVFKGRAVDEYKDPDLFFSQTYLTHGLQNLIEVVKKRISGEGGDPIIQLETPFGGGKTHSLIALYHKTTEWSANKIVIVGTALNPEKQTLWGLIEEQLTGKMETFHGRISPGKEELRKLLEQYQPLVILIDEVLEYVTKASGIRVAETNLGAQTTAFIHEISEVVSTLEKTCLIITLPSSDIEHYDINAEKLFQRLKKLTGRVEKVYTPVRDEEISHIVRKRLFERIDMEELKTNVLELFGYLQKEGILPSDIDPSIYKNRLMNSYPFLPDVIDCIYHRWGSYPSFQRTRGLLRLLSIVIYSMIGTNRGYISLADFNLENDDLRREFLKHIGNEYDSVVAADITEETSNSKKMDASLASTYRGQKIGSRISNTIFLYSFSGGQEKGATLLDIKRSATTIDIPSAIVGETISKMENELFYLHKVADKYLFTTKPNLNRIILTKMDNVEENQILDVEHEQLTKIVGKNNIPSYIWPKDESDIADNKLHKLVILKKEDERFMKKILEYKGASFPRVYRNTIFFLTSSESKRLDLHSSIKKLIAWEQILNDATIRMNEEQKKQAKQSYEKSKENIWLMIREAYRYLIIPDKEGFDRRDLGVPTYGEEINLGKEVLTLMKSEDIIVDKISPEILKLKFLKDKEYVSTKQIYESSLTTIGETRLFNKDVLVKCIVDGVKNASFGLGLLTSENEYTLSYWKEEAEVTFSEEEIILSAEKCEILSEKEEILDKIDEIDFGKAKTNKQGVIQTQLELDEDILPVEDILEEIDLPDFVIPKGKVSEIMRLVNYIQSKFERINIKITASEGKITKGEYEDKIIEALKQIGIDIDF